MKKNKRTSTDFMTRDTTREVVAAELFIPIVEELYDKNIFTNWSGLTGDAHKNHLKNYLKCILKVIIQNIFLIKKQVLILE